MRKNKSLLIAGLVLGSFVVAASNGAAGLLGRTDYVSINRATALPGVVLAPGQYVFEAVEGRPDIVRVFDRATKRVLYMGFTELIPRPDGVTNILSLGEAPAGEPVPIKVWFPTGARRGHAFNHR
jgi:hypothetical protein